MMRRSFQLISLFTLGTPVTVLAQVTSNELVLELIRLAAICVAAAVTIYTTRRKRE